MLFAKPKTNPIPLQFDSLILIVLFERMTELYREIFELETLHKKYTNEPLFPSNANIIELF